MILAVVPLPVVPVDDDSPVRNAAGIITGAEIEDGNEGDRPTAAEYTASEFPASAPRSNATNCGACGSAMRRPRKKRPPCPAPVSRLAWPQGGSCRESAPAAAKPRRSEEHTSELQ